MTTTNLKTIEAFLAGNQLAAFAVLDNKTQRYDFIRKTLTKCSYMSSPKKDKGIVIIFYYNPAERSSFFTPYIW